MRISYFYDLPMPSPLAAPIQILNTCRALCDLGAWVTVYTNRLTAPSVDEGLAYYGIEPHERLHIVPFFAGVWRRFWPGWNLERALASLSVSERHVIISRGEPGLEVFDWLRRRPRDAGRLHVYEAHRLCYPQVATFFRPRLPLARAWRIRRATAQARQREQRTVLAADGLVCVTRGVADAVRREFGTDRPTLILPSGVTLVQDQPGDATSRDIDILYAGKLERRKGVFDLLDAMRFLPGYRLMIVGGGPEEIAPLARRASEIGVAEQVTFTGLVPPGQVGAYYARARVGVCPLPRGESAISEAFTSPLKVLEMMAHGVVVVGTDLPSLREMLVHERTALLAPPSDPPALARTIHQALTDPALARRLTRAALEAVETYSWRNRARRLLDFLERMETPAVG